MLVVGEHPLPRRLFRQLRDLGGRLERQRELSVAATDRLTTRGDTETPEELAPRPPFVTGAGRDERFERIVFHGRRDARGRQDRGRAVVRRPTCFGLADRLHVAKTNSHCRSVFDVALRFRAVDVRRAYLHSAPLRITHERRWRIEAHRLCIHQRAQKLRRVIAAAARLTGRRAARMRLHATSGSRSLQNRRAGRRSHVRSRRRCPCRRTSTKRGRHASMASRLRFRLIARRSPSASPIEKPAAAIATSSTWSWKTTTPSVSCRASRSDSCKTGGSKPWGRLASRAGAHIGMNCLPWIGPGRTSATCTVRSSRCSGRVCSRLCICARLSIWKTPTVSARWISS